MTEYKLVPVEPTEEMLRLAVKRASMIGGVRIDWPTLRVTYKAMLEAAPTPKITPEPNKWGLELSAEPPETES